MQKRNLRKSNLEASTIRRGGHRGEESPAAGGGFKVLESLIKICRQ